MISKSDTTGPTATGNMKAGHPWITPVTVTFEMEVLAQNLIIGKGLLYTEELYFFMKGIES